MHEQNIAIIQELYRSFREKDHNAFKSICAPDVEWRQNKGFPRGAVHRGADAVVDRVFKAFNDDWSSFGFKIDRFLSTEDAVMVLGRYTGKPRGKAASAEVNAEAAHVYFLRDGKVTMFQQYADTKVLWDALSLS